MENSRSEAILNAHMDYVKDIAEGNDPKESEERLAGLEKYLKFFNLADMVSQDFSGRMI